LLLHWVSKPSTSFFFTGTAKHPQKLLIKMKYIFLLFCILCFVRGMAAQQWTSLRGTAEGRAVVTYSGNAQITEWHYVYKSSRRFETGIAVWASPALAVIANRPMAFIGGYDQTLHALDLEEKKAVWRKITNGEIRTAPVLGKIDGLDIVFFSSADRTVYAYVAYNGRQFWTKELVPPSPTLGDVHLSSPLVFYNKLYITCFAYDKSLSANKQEPTFFALTREAVKSIGSYW
jgi:outer membrane protein assembly factor BamB